MLCRSGSARFIPEGEIPAELGNGLKKVTYVLCTYRDVEVQRSPALSQLIGDLTREGTQVPLFGLSREDAARMIAERAGAQPIPRLVSDIPQATAGNPLFIDCLVRVMAAEGRLESASRLNLAAFRVPDGVREAIRRWLAQLSDRSPLVVAATHMTPDKPFFIYFGPGALHAPHHIPQTWRDKYKGKFTEGWDKYREDALAQKQLGLVPQNTRLAPWPRASSIGMR